MKYWKQFLAIAISAFFLYLTLRNIDLKLVPIYIKKFSIPLILCSFVVYLLQYILRSVRWQIILSPVKKTSLKNLYNINVIGFMANAILPARIGEVVRMLLLSKKENIKFSTSFASIVVERVFDGIGMFFILGLTLVFVRVSDLKIGRYIYGFFIIFLALLLFILLSYAFHKVVIRVVKSISFLPAKFVEFFEREIGHFVDGMHIIKRLSELIKIILLTFLTWLVIASFYYFFIKAFAFSVTFDVVKGTLLMSVITAIGVSVPSGPGYAGPYHYAVKLSLLAIASGLGNTELAVFAVVMHLCYILFSVILGVIGLWSFGMGFGEITKLQNEK